MPRSRTGSIVIRNGNMNARITYMGTDGKRHAIWRAAKNRTHAKQLLVEIANLLGTKALPQHRTARRRHGFVYAIRMEVPADEKPIKIGFSVHVESRAASLACGSPYPITVLGFWETANGDLEEREIHKCFRADRLEGEWFRPSEALLAMIKDRVENYRRKLSQRAQQLRDCES